MEETNKQYARYDEDKALKAIEQAVKQSEIKEMIAVNATGKPEPTARAISTTMKEDAENGGSEEE